MSDRLPEPWHKLHGDVAVSRDVHTALRAAIEQRLARARRMERMAQEYQLEVQEPKLLGKHVPGWGEWPEVEQMAHQLAEVCEADLRRLERHKPCKACAAPGGYAFEHPMGLQCHRCVHLWPCDEGTDMASAYGLATTSAALNIPGSQDMTHMPIADLDRAQARRERGVTWMDDGCPPADVDEPNGARATWIVLTRDMPALLDEVTAARATITNLDTEVARLTAELAKARAQADRSWRLLADARNACKRLTAGLIANASLLDTPFTNAPDLSPWSRSIKPAIDGLRAALGMRGAVRPPCCDMHNRNCEPPSELCCEQCTEATHPDHADGSVCIAPDLSAPALASPPAATWQPAKPGDTPGELTPECPPVAEPTAAIDLMAALRASLERAKADRPASLTPDTEDIRQPTQAADYLESVSPTPQGSSPAQRRPQPKLES